MSEEVDSPHDDQSRTVDGLNWLERTGATLVGLVGVGVGGTGIFLSDNQAGTTAMLLLGAVFLLMGIQGTAIKRATKDSVEWERRRQKRFDTAVQAGEILEERGPDEAELFIEGAKAADPGITSEPAVRRLDGILFERQVLDALKRTIPRAGLDPARYRISSRIDVHGPEIDIVVSDKEDGLPKLFIEVKMLPTQGSRILRSMQNAIEQLSQYGKPGLIVANRYIPVPILESLRLDDHNPPIHYALWRGPEDDESLVLELRRLLDPEQ